jgi:hypothetical protein
MKPVCKLIGQDGNIFNLLGLAIRALRDAQQLDKIPELTERVQRSNSYDEALRVLMEYVEVE